MAHVHVHGLAILARSFRSTRAFRSPPPMRDADTHKQTPCMQADSREAHCYKWTQHTVMRVDSCMQVAFRIKDALHPLLPIPFQFLSCKL